MMRGACGPSVAIGMVLAGCYGTNPEVPVAYNPARGDAEHGRTLIESYRCGTCHTIPGVRAAHGTTAAPLSWFASRTFIGGEVPNTPANLIVWLRNPRDIEPRTAMPALGVTEAQARDMAAYLYTVR